MRHAYGNAHIHADGDCDAYIHSDCNSDSNCHSYSHGYGDGHSHIHAYGYSDRYIYAYRNGDSYGYCDSDGNSDRVAAYTDATASAHTAASSLALFRLGNSRERTREFPVSDGFARRSGMMLN